MCIYMHIRMYICITCIACGYTHVRASVYECAYLNTCMKCAEVRTTTPRSTMAIQRLLISGLICDVNEYMIHTCHIECVL